MEKVTLIKNNKKEEFTTKAAIILKEHFGWSDYNPAEKPAEVGTRTKPIPITKPVKLIDPETVKDDYPSEKKDIDKVIDAVNDDLAQAAGITEASKVNDDLGTAKPDKFVKTRKPRTKSKSK